ncbi:hypothetical protein ACTXT7_006781 [Hymenolepis weldensis]
MEIVQLATGIAVKPNVLHNFTIVFQEHRVGKTEKVLRANMDLIEDVDITGIDMEGEIGEKDPLQCGPLVGPPLANIGSDRVTDADITGIDMGEDIDEKELLQYIPLVEPSYQVIALVQVVDITGINIDENIGEKDLLQNSPAPGMPH